jgi:hypothetical protein
MYKICCTINWINNPCWIISKCSFSSSSSRFFSNKSKNLNFKIKKLLFIYFQFTYVLEIFLAISKLIFLLHVDHILLQDQLHQILFLHVFLSKTLHLRPIKYRWKYFCFFLCMTKISRPSFQQIYRRIDSSLQTTGKRKVRFFFLLVYTIGIYLLYQLMTRDQEQFCNKYQFLVLSFFFVEG